MKKEIKLGKDECLQNMKCFVCNNGVIEHVGNSCSEEIGICNNCKSVYFKSPENKVTVEVIRNDITKRKQQELQIEKQVKSHFSSGTKHIQTISFLIMLGIIITSAFIGFIPFLMLTGSSIIAFVLLREKLKHKIGMSLSSEKLLIKNIKDLAKQILEGKDNVSEYSTSNRYSDNEYFNKQECIGFIREILDGCNLVCKDITIKESYGSYKILVGIKKHDTSEESLIQDIDTKISSLLYEKKLGIHNYFNNCPYRKNEWVYMGSLTFQKHLCLKKDYEITGYADMYNEELILKRTEKVLEQAKAKYNNLYIEKEESDEFITANIKIIF